MRLPGTRNAPRALGAVLGAVLGLGVALALTACSEGVDTPADTSGPPVLEAPDGSPDNAEPLQVLVRDGAGEGANEARVIGSLAAVGSCVGIQGESSVYPVVFPEGTTSDGSTLTLPDGTALSFDDQLDTGGGYLTVPLPDGVPAPPADCLGQSGEVVVLND